MLRIVTADSWVLEALCVGTFRATVHSLFKHTVNMICSQTGTLCSLVHDRGDNGPGALVTNVPDFTTLPLALAMPVTVANDCLQMGDVRVLFSGARAWNPAAFPVRVHRPLLNANRLALVTASACAHQQGNVPRARLYALLSGPAACVENSPLERQVHHLLTTRTESMIHALTCNDGQRAYENATGLLGLGQGLTPSGDDILLGFLAACSVYLGTDVFDAQESLGLSTSRGGPHPAMLEALGVHIVAKAQHATHVLSWAGIAEAAQGRMRTTLSSFILALLTGTEQDVERTLVDLLAIGSCSGADLAYGILSGFEGCFGQQGLNLRAF